MKEKLFFYVTFSNGSSSIRDAGSGIHGETAEDAIKRWTNYQRPGTTLVIAEVSVDGSKQIYLGDK